MSRKKVLRWVALLGSLAILGFLVYFYSPIGCTVAPSAPPSMGSHGFRVRSGETFKSFEHTGGKICVPEGFEAVGEVESGFLWARFPESRTGVFIQSSAFVKKNLQLVYSSYEPTVIYPASTPASDAELYEAATRNTFERTGTVFLDSNKNKKRTHDVLVTVGIETNGTTHTRLYPDPHALLTVIVDHPLAVRGEELLIHAITHLYNRYGQHATEYQNNQEPLPKEDFQEFEATWAESAFRTSTEGRKARLKYLYEIHEAVISRDYSQVRSYPFNSSREAFDEITGVAVVQKDDSFLTAQYAHYVLAPLTMVGIEGMLSKKERQKTVEDILKEVHKTDANFFELLTAHLTKDESAQVRSWMFEEKRIPFELIEAGFQSYTGT